MSVSTRRRGDTTGLEQGRADLVVALRAARLHDFTEGIDNHFSLAIGGERFLINRYGPDWSEITTADILTLDMDGNLVDGSGEWEFAAFTIHRAVHTARPDARAVLHTHMPWATAVTLGEAGLMTTLSQSAMYFHGRVQTLPYAGIATADAEGERIRRLLDDRADVVLMENHGVLVVGASLAQAWHRLYFLERACQLQVIAASTGQPLRTVTEAVAAQTFSQWRAVEEYAAPKLFDSLRRRVGNPARIPGPAREHPDSLARRVATG
jgi:ribulose-5-phosphate 4-epimerase/fuculose-1-phosphate aldolase